MADMGEKIRSAATEWKEKALRAGERATTAWNETRKDLQERAFAQARVTDKRVREHPYSAIGIAFGIGLLIGVLSSRNR